MGKLAPVHCRICKGEIDRNIEKEGEDWIMPSKNFYYHVECYNNWRVSSTHDDQDWIELIYDFIARDLKVSYNYFLCEQQRQKYIEQKKYTNKGIYFSLKYFYEIKKGDWNKGKGGIGIIPYVYEDATQYWIQLEQRRKGVIENLEKQAIIRNDRAVKKLSQYKKKSTSKWTLDEI